MAALYTILRELSINSVGVPDFGGVALGSTPGCGYARVSPVVAGKCLVMITTLDTNVSHITAGANVDDTNLDAMAATYGTTRAAVCQNFVGVIGSDQSIPTYIPVGQIPAKDPSLPADIPNIQALIDAAAGGTLSLAEGTYRADSITIPVNTIVQPVHPYDRVVLCTPNGTIWGTVIDCEMYDDNPDRISTKQGWHMKPAGARVWGCLNHDNKGGGGLIPYDSGYLEIQETVIYNNGVHWADGSPHDHCIYTHNNNGSTPARLFQRLILLGGIGDRTLQAYSAGGNHVWDYEVAYSFSALKRALVGGTGGAKRINIHHNMLCDAYFGIGEYTPTNSCDDFTLANNVLTDNAYFNVDDTAFPPGLISDSVDASGNISTDTGFVVHPGLEAGFSISHTAQVMVNPCTKSARWIGFVYVANPLGAANILVDLSSLTLPNGSYYLHNAQSYWGYKLPFTISGGVKQVTIPLHAADWDAPDLYRGLIYGPANTLPQNGAFIVSAH